jgi:hypothetical protein
MMIFRGRTSRRPLDQAAGIEFIGTPADGAGIRIRPSPTVVHDGLTCRSRLGLLKTVCDACSAQNDSPVKAPAVGGNALRSQAQLRPWQRRYAFGSEIIASAMFTSQKSCCATAGIRGSREQQRSIFRSHFHTRCAALARVYIHVVLRVLLRGDQVAGPRNCPDFCLTGQEPDAIGHMTSEALWLGAVIGESRRSNRRSIGTGH